MKSIFQSPWSVDAIAILACAGAAAVAQFAGVAPLLDAREREVQARAELSAKRTEARELEVIVGRLEQELHSVMEALENGQLELMDQSKLNQRLSELYTLAGECELEISGVTPAAGRDEELYAVVPITINGTGSYPQIARFMHRLRNEQGDMGVDAFDITRGEREGLSVMFKLYWYAALADSDVAENG